jgi:hypothetical protein
MHSTGRLSSHRSGALPITRGKYPNMWSLLPRPRRAGSDVVHLEPNTWLRATVIFFNGWFEVLGVSDHLEMSWECWEVVDCSRTRWWGVGCQDDIEVIRRTIILVVLGMTRELLIMHLPNVCRLDRVIGVKGIRDPIAAVVVSTTCYVCFITYGLTLVTPGTCILS